MNYVFNRGFIGLLDDKEVTIYSLDIVEKIINNDLKEEDTLTFKTNEKTIKDLRYKMKYGMRINLKVQFKNEWHLDVDLVLNLPVVYSGQGDNVTTECKIKECYLK